MELGGLEEELTEVSAGRLASGSRWGEEGTKQLEHMAHGMTVITPSPAVLFIYLPFSCFADGRAQAGLE